MSFKIIPAIDIISGQCVRLTKGNYYEKKVYSLDPFSVAKNFVSMGYNRIHLVDLDGAKAGKIINWETVEKLLQINNLELEFSGGIRQEIDINKLLDLGIAKIGISKVATKNPKLFSSWLEKYGQSKFVLALDCNQKLAKKVEFNLKNYLIKSDGWQNTELQNITYVLDLYKSYLGLEIICTDTNLDGTLAGPNFELYENLIKNYPNQKFIASGGIRDAQDLKKLQNLGLYGAVLGKAIYENKFNLTTVL